MKKLLSFPQNFAGFLHENPRLQPESSFVCADPPGRKISSGGGTVNLIYQSFLEETKDVSLKITSSRNRNAREFWSWFRKEKRILIHAGGESRRLPAYAPVGKLFMPVPVFRWDRGQKIAQTLLDLQLPLYERILDRAPERLNTLICSGDVLIRSEKLPEIPDKDIVCFGLWGDADLSSRHGVFICSREKSGQLEFVLQKPSIKEIRELSKDYHFMLDIGIWLLSEKAIRQLFRKCGWNDNKKGFRDEKVNNYDLYSEFGFFLGESPKRKDKKINSLSVAILPLPDGEFFHFGTCNDLISSTDLLQNRIQDQREIWHRKIKVSADIFTMNAITENDFSEENSRIWIENSHISAGWKITGQHILTGIPENNWEIDLPEGICLDVIPIGQNKYCIRTYGMNDVFKGQVGREETTWHNTTAGSWLKRRSLSFELAGIDESADIQQANLFPVLNQRQLSGDFINWMVKENPPGNDKFRELWLKVEKLTASRINESVNFTRLFQQRKKFLHAVLPAMAQNFRQSVFYQLDMNDLAAHFAGISLKLPPALPGDVPLMTRIHDQMFRAKVLFMEGRKYSKYENNAFDLLREGILEGVRSAPVSPEPDVFPDQIVWARSPVRWDLAGGWTDTPPYCITHGGKVINMAIELNGQPPLQVYIKPISECKIVLRSIDLGEKENIHEFDDLTKFNRVGSAFAIPKAALCLAGIHPLYSLKKFRNLKDLLKDLGCGVDISMLSAVPKGSGLGTSSILAATVLGALSDFYHLRWDRNEVCFRTLALEQLLTTGGGWQDQFGGMFGGIKLLESVAGFNQRPQIKWAPDQLFSIPDSRPLILLYYTGVTRIAKNILAEIVRSMFLNASPHLSVLSEMKHHAIDTYEAIQQSNWNKLVKAVNVSWVLNQRLDSGTNTPEIQSILDKISDYMVACKLLGAGGGGYMIIIAKDPAAAFRIRQILSISKPNPRARFVDWAISKTGLQISRS